LLAIPWLLDQLAVRPQELAVVTWGAWLLLPAWILWLNLFPVHGTMPLWAAGGLPLVPAFLWAVKDAVVIHLLLAVWRQMPALQMESVLSTLRTLGLLTALFSGIWAVLQSSLSGVLGCAAMSVLGLVVQGLAAGSADGLSAALFLLLSRSAVVLLASAALTVLYDGSADTPQETRKRLPWEGLVLWLISVGGVLALLLLPRMGNPAQGRSLLTVLQAQEPRLWQAWRISSAGVLIGLAHTSWRLWRDQVRSSAGRIRPVSFLLAVCLFLLCLYLALSPEVVASWVSGLMLF
jgi:formate hydrogenlyase subunit 3/multisubunit Na+/H+ antiporter MnhD subunit